MDGVAPDRIIALLEYERGPPFFNTERVTLSVTQAAGQTRNAESDNDVVTLKQYFDEDQIVEIVAVIFLFGWLSRFNDTIAPEPGQRSLA